MRQTRDFIISEKEAGIHKGNKRLLDRLIEISSGKTTWKGTLPKIEQRNQMKSLNYSKRKNNITAIEKENLALAKRLIER